MYYAGLDISVKETSVCIVDETPNGNPNKETEMSDSKSLYVVDLTYVVPLSEVDRHVPGHIDFLDDSYASGLFLVSGAKVPRTGGVIIANVHSRSELEDHLTKDPFHKNGIAEYRVTEFKASKHQPHLFG